MIYHITTIKSLNESLSTREYKPDNFNQDGFIHCSTRDQILNVANRFYSDQNDLILLQIDEDNLSSKIIFENLEGSSDLFPHIYGKLPYSAISRLARLQRTDEGFVFPDTWVPGNDIINMVK